MSISVGLTEKVLLPRFSLSAGEIRIMVDLEIILAVTYFQPEYDDPCGHCGRVEHVDVLSLIRDRPPLGGSNNRALIPPDKFEVPYKKFDGMYLRRARILIKKQRIDICDCMENEVSMTSISYYIGETLRKVISLYIGREIPIDDVVFGER